MFPYSNWREVGLAVKTQLLRFWGVRPSTLLIRVAMEIWLRVQLLPLIASSSTLSGNLMKDSCWNNRGTNMRLAIEKSN